MVDNFQNIHISKNTLSIDACYNAVLNKECGGNVLFVGTVRNQNKGHSVTHLDFETYKPMALKEMQKIAEKAKSLFEIKNIVIHHREGFVGIKDIAVIIAVSSVHRENAFKACSYAIDQLKNSVPIWKKEHLEDGSYWVNARP